MVKLPTGIDHGARKLRAVPCMQRGYLLNTRIQFHGLWDMPYFGPNVLPIQQQALQPATSFQYEGEHGEHEKPFSGKKGRQKACH